MKPILVSDLLDPVDARLIELLRSLTPATGMRDSLGSWKVRDVAAHLLDTQLRKLSRVRDGHMPGPPPQIRSSADLVAFVNRLDREGVEITAG